MWETFYSKFWEEIQCNLIFSLENQEWKEYETVTILKYKEKMKNEEQSMFSVICKVLKTQEQGETIK